MRPPPHLPGDDVCMAEALLEEAPAHREQCLVSLHALLAWGVWKARHPHMCYALKQRRRKLYAFSTVQG